MDNLEFWFIYELKIEFEKGVDIFARLLVLLFEVVVEVVASVGSWWLVFGGCWLALAVGGW